MREARDIVLAPIISEKSYDAIIMDAYARQVSIPAALATPIPRTTASTINTHNARFMRHLLSLYGRT